MSRLMSERFVVIDKNVARSDFAADVRRGLTAPRKFLLPIYFYDALGSALFDAICELPEYYVTRAETAVLQRHAYEMVDTFGAPVRLIELGSGSAQKTRILFDAIGGDIDYVPIDVDRTMLEKTARQLTYDYDRISVTAICADIRKPKDWSADALSSDKRNVVLFLGSTIGNLSFDEATTL